MSDHPFAAGLRAADLTRRTGRVRRLRSTYVEADGPALPLGALCELQTASAPALAEVVAVDDDRIILALFDNRAATFPGARVWALAAEGLAPVGDGFLGRVVDALGRPLDGGTPIVGGLSAPLDGPYTEPLERASPRQVFETGVRAIDGLLTLAQGQRVGVFAAAGVGKTSLITQIARQTGAERCVFCLVGERGREVEALWREGLTPQTRARSVMVAATSDQSAAMRARAGRYAVTLAEHWRDQGHGVLLVIDSVTRLAMALREIGLAAGEPPTVRAYTPGVFAAIPRLVERCGALRKGGAVTAIMTVLCETDDVDDPIAEMMKSLLDGHLVLSRGLAEQGHFPAIDAPRSVSRLARQVVDAPHRVDAARALEALSTYETARTLIETGVYAAGASADIDRAIAARPALLAFLRQDRDEPVTWAAGRAQLRAAVGTNP